jgi:thioester reductase-like protein
MKTNVLLTGATGFVGVHLLLEILQQTDSEIYCIVRSNGGDANSRLSSLIIETIRNAHYPNALVAQVVRRVHVVQGDLTQDLSEVASQLPSISVFWHCAASLNYEDSYAKQISAINVDGTSKALDLARKKGAEEFNYISTAYVAGRSTGLILEQPVAEVEHSNFYEHSKVLAERLVLAERSMKTRIFRPSIVIGHSASFHAFNFSGLYGFLRRLIQFKNTMARINSAFLQTESISLLVDADIPLNLVPVDMVASQAVRIARSDSEKSIFHLTNSHVPSVGESLNVAFGCLGINPPRIVNSMEGLGKLDTKFNSRIDFYSSYLSGHKAFDRTNSDSALGEVDASRPFAITEESFAKHCTWFRDLMAGGTVPADA